MHKIKTEQFEGPLDLLLQLIEEQKLNITEITLAKVTDQYLDVLQKAAETHIKAEELADFLVVAARLLLLKSRALLPFLQWEEEEGEELTHQLRIYKEYADAAKVVQKLIAKQHFSFSRQKLLTTQDIGFQPPQKLTYLKLHTTYREILRALNPVLNLPTDVLRRTVNLQEKIEHIRLRILRNASASFSEILRDAKDKTEVIVSFLALLELVKQQIVVVRQDRVFDDIVIQKAVEHAKVS